MEQIAVAETLLSCARETMNKLPDNRRPSNATKYTMLSTGMGALSVFFMQDPSFLSHQMRLNQQIGNNNFNTLFGVKEIPTPNQIRNILDNIEPDKFYSIFDEALKILHTHSGLEQFLYLSNNGYLIALDGVEYHCSQKINCQHCNTRTIQGKTYNYHTMLAATIVSPEINAAIPLRPEFITSHIEESKQDCENAAIKRWLEKNAASYQYLNPTLLGDDLYSRQTICQAVLDKNLHFIFVCKPDSHKILYEYLAGVQLSKHVLNIKKRHKHYIYQLKYINQVPIKDGKDALSVNWLEIIIIDKKTSKKIYHNSFVTSHLITDANILSLTLAGRARWKIENENNNTLKTKGYNFEHNYGHGKKNLASVFASLSLLAFLFHTIISLVCKLYAAARQSQSSRIAFFNVLRSLTSFLCFSSWHSLLTFIIKPPDHNILRF